MANVPVFEVEEVYSYEEVKAQAERDFPLTFAALPAAGHTMLVFEDQSFLPCPQYFSTAMLVGYIKVEQVPMAVLACMSVEGKIGFYIRDFGVEVARKDYKAIMFATPFSLATRENSENIRLRKQRSLAAFFLVREGKVENFCVVGGISIDNLKVACEWFAADFPAVSYDAYAQKCIEALQTSTGAAVIPAAQGVEAHQPTGSDAAIDPAQQLEAYPDASSVAIMAAAQDSEARQPTDSGAAVDPAQQFEVHPAASSIATMAAAQDDEAHQADVEMFGVDPFEGTEGHQAGSEEEQRKIEKEELTIRREFMDGELGEEKTEKTQGFKRGTA